MSKKEKKLNSLSLPAIEIKQGPKQKIYIFAVDGKRLPEIATISRIHRDTTGGVDGYQRPEVLAHVAEIRRYLESENPLLPNALVVAFNNSVKFQPSNIEAGDASGYTKMGFLVVPLDDSLPEEEKPGWIVDGQQRTAAIQGAALDSFPISVVGFITGDVGEQRTQFILVNETKPLPHPLIDELLPGVNGALPKRLTLRVLPTRLVERLNNDEDSPLHMMIKTQTRPDGVIAANSMIQGLKSSITDGSLYFFRDPMTGEGDVEAMLSLLKPFWGAVQEVFCEDWGLPTRHSRLMHGTGVRSLLSLMDEIVGEDPSKFLDNQKLFEESLEVIKPICQWSDGYWDLGNGEIRKWNDIQNLAKDRDMISRLICREYRTKTV